MFSTLQSNIIALISRVRNSRFSRDVASVGAGIAIAQAISLAFTPFLTRLYGPEAFGVLGAFTAVVTIISPLATLSYTNAIVLPKEDQDAFAVVRLSLMVSLAATLLVFGIVHVFIEQFARWTALEAQRNLLYLIPLTLFLSAVFSVASQIAIRFGLFASKSFAYVEGVFLVNVLKLIFGWLNPTGLILILIYVFSSGIYVLTLLPRLVKLGLVSFGRWFGSTGTATVAWKYRDFPIYRMPQSVINAASLGLPVILLTNYFGSSSAGHYSLAALVLGAPVMLLGQSVGEVFYRKISLAISERHATVHNLISKATVVLLLVGIVPFGLVALFGDYFFPFAFGSEWVRAGEYSQWISLWLLSTLMSRPSIAAMPSLEMQRHLLFYEIVITGLRFAAIWFGAVFYTNDILAIAFFSIVNVIGYLTLIGMVFARSIVRDRMVNDVG